MVVGSDGFPGIMARGGACGSGLPNSVSNVRVPLADLIVRPVIQPLVIPF